MILKSVFRNSFTSSPLSYLKMGAIVLVGLVSVPLKAQIAPAYEVADWKGFKKAAVSYTFDDNTSNQLKVAIPIFDQYDFKTTLFIVTNWGPNWAELEKASANGHEVASHTVSHPSLNTLSAEEQESELQESQNMINDRISVGGVLTIAYPNCNVGDEELIEQYYLAGRICSGRIEPTTPADFYRISSIIAGSAGAVKTAEDFNSTVETAGSTNGWAVFLMHGIDYDGGYSPLASSVLESHLAYMDENREDYWVATFREVAKYIKERDALSLVETRISADSLKLEVRDGLENEVYNVPVTIRRELPAGWEKATVYANKEKLSASITTEGNKQYVVFDVVPDQGDVYLVNSDGIISGLTDLLEAPSIKAGPNPFSNSLKVEMKGAFRYFIYSLDGKLLEEGEAKNSCSLGAKLSSGIYMLKIKHNKQLYASKIVKR